MINAFAWPSLLASAISFVLGVYILIKERKERIIWFFFIIALVGSLTALTDALIKITTDSSQGLVYITLHNICFFIFITFVFHFMLILAEKEYLLKNRVFMSLFYAIPLVICYFMASGSLIIAGVKRQSWGFQVVYGPFTWVANLFLMVYPIAALYFYTSILWSKAGALKKEQTRVVLIGIGIAALFGIFFGVILPWWFEISAFESIVTAPVVVLIVASFAYGIARYGARA